MDSAAFTYVTYINSTAEKVWEALTNGDLSRQYWSNHRNSSDWKVGSQWHHQDADNPSVVDVTGTILESVRPKRLAFTWSAPDDSLEASKLSRVAFDIDEDDGMVRLSLAHDRLGNSDLAQGIAEGWPLVLSSLKTFLETGTPMPEIWIRDGDGWTRNKFK